MASPTAVTTPTVLLVDDHEDSRVIYSMALEAAGFRVLQARDGSECIVCARAQRPDVVVLDIEMPVMNGLAALRELRDDTHTASLPVIAVTAATNRYMRGELAEAGFDAVLLKPARPELVIAAIRQAVSGDRKRTG